MIKLNPKDIIKENKESKKEYIKESENEDLYSNVRSQSALLAVI